MTDSVKEGGTEAPSSSQKIKKNITATTKRTSKLQAEVECKRNKTGVSLYGMAREIWGIEEMI